MAVDDGHAAPAAGDDRVKPTDEIVVGAIIQGDAVTVVACRPAPIDRCADNVAFNNITLCIGPADINAAPAVKANAIAVPWIEAPDFVGLCPTIDQDAVQTIAGIKGAVFQANIIARDHVADGQTAF